MGLINLWTDPRYFDVDKFVDSNGNVPAEFLQSAFLTLKPIANLIGKPINLMEKHPPGRIRRCLSPYGSVAQRQHPGSRRGLSRVCKIPLRTLPTKPADEKPDALGRHIVDLRKITCPLLNLMARNDDLVPRSQTEPLNDLVSSTDKEKIIWPAGHIGLAVSGRLHKELWPWAVDWLVQRTG